MLPSEAAQRARRRRRDEIGSGGHRYRVRGEIEELGKSPLESRRRVHLDHDRQISTKRIVGPVLGMVSSSLSLSGSRSASKHRHRTVHGRSVAEAKPEKRRSVSRGLAQVLDSRANNRLPTGRKLEERATGDSDRVDSDEAALSVVSEETEPKEKAKEVEVIYTRSERPRPSRHSSRRTFVDDIKPMRDPIKFFARSLSRSNTTPSQRTSKDSPSKSTKLKGPSTSHSSLKRRHSTSHPPVASKSTYEPSMSSAKLPPRRGSLFGIFSPSPKEEKPEKKIECVVCLSDDIPISKSAKLKCGHIMCNSCLKRVFNLSVTDPQHMPPKCCTSDLIPLKHVDRLFDAPFKNKWNKKYQEFTTKNRIYCPTRRCGEWIKPSNIRTEGGKKYGKCSRCDTKVCVLCNGKWHGKKDCPKDAETNAILDAAKQAGWQRCFNCRTMVELKEGCNHMTCRCTAEFCMLCGLKWRTCTCPWFSHEQVEDDRRAHIDRPGGFNPDNDLIDDIWVPARPRRPQAERRPRAYRDEVNVRRQERIDEMLARGIGVLGLDDNDNDMRIDIAIEGVRQEFHDPFWNEGRRRPSPRRRRADFDTERDGDLDGHIPPLPRPRPVNREPNILANDDIIERVHVHAEQPILRRSRTDYASDAARHAPLPIRPLQRRSHTEGPAPAPAPTPRLATLAGLRGGGRGGSRVSAWIEHVEPGVTPDEGVISMVGRH